MMMMINIIMCKVCEAVSPLPGSVKSCVSDWIWKSNFNLVAFAFAPSNLG
jgi:hypothetical protein